MPQRVDEGVWPVPPDCALDTAFDLTKFTGRWYITAGLNPLFDTFPCQEHFFGNPEAGKNNLQTNFWSVIHTMVTHITTVGNDSQSHSSFVTEWCGVQW